MSFRWHPYAVDPARDYTAEERTLVSFSLEAQGENETLVRVVESGFDRLAPERRLEAFRMNDRGWQAQLQNVQDHGESR